MGFEMALTLAFLYLLIGISITLFIIGFTRISVQAGFSFTALSGVILILTGLFLWTGGLQSNTLEPIDTNEDIIQLQYEVLTFENSEFVMLLSYLFTFGGFFPIILAIRNVFAYQQHQKELLKNYSY
jgi:nitrate/nitrite transporter NarK